MAPRSTRKRSPDPSFASVYGRSEACRIAPSDWVGALDVARAVPDGWYRAQALSAVAEHAPASHVADLLDEAVKAANACDDEYGRVAVLCWPLHVAFRRGHVGFAERERDRALMLAPLIQPLASRAYALQMLWRQCHGCGPLYAEPVWQTILRHCPPDRSWRAARAYLRIAEVLEFRNPGSAIEVVRAMPEGKARTRLARRLGIEDG